MDFSLSNILHIVGQALLTPCLVVLLLLMIVTVWQIGDILVEFIAERLRHRQDVPPLIKEIHAAGRGKLLGVIENSKLLRRQKATLFSVIKAADLPKEELVALAQRQLATEEARNQRATVATDMVAKLGPMFGLLGTLIPLGPGIVALGQGDTQTLSNSLGVAFDTTIAGLISAAVASVISNIRKRWYSDDSVTMEALMETVLQEVVGDAE